MSDMPWSWLSPFSQTFDKFVNNPVTNWGRFFNPQMIFNYNPEDAPIEAHVLSKVGSYGSQISTLLDMVAVLRRRLPTEALDERDAQSVKAFDDLCDTAQKAVDEFRGAMTADDIIAAARAFQKRDPAGAERLRDRLDTALEKP
jgi:hypothetical protein